MRPVETIPRNPVFICLACGSKWQYRGDGYPGPFLDSVTRVHANVVLGYAELVDVDTSRVVGRYAAEFPHGIPPVEVIPWVG
jgi:hypothetical protein